MFKVALDPVNSDQPYFFQLQPNHPGKIADGDRLFYSNSLPPRLIGKELAK
jgi:hypothetical protein